MTGRHVAPRHRAPRKRIGRGGLAACAVLAVVAGYGLVSVHSWAGFDERTQEWSAASQVFFDEVSGESERPFDERTVAVRELRASIDQLTIEAQDMCTPAAVIRWQSSLGAGGTSQRSCQESVDRVSHLAQKLDDVTRYIEDENDLARLLAPLQDIGTDIVEDDIAATLAVWEETRDEVAEQWVSEAFEPTRADLLDAMDDVLDVWRALNEAHEEQDLLAFAAARDVIADAYAAFEEVSAASADRLTALDEAFVTAYREVYADR